jgi:TatD DNase family protein
MLKPVFVDTHCHLDLPPLSTQLPDVLARARAAGVSRFTVPGVTPEGWPQIAALAATEPAVLPAFGLHPCHAQLFCPELLAELALFLPLATAIGEIGLDYLVPFPGRQVQQEAFRAQLRLAVAAGMPVLIHCRKAFQDLLLILREERVDRVGGVMHAFSGSPETAAACVRLGLFIGISGTATYRNAVRPVAVVRQVPLEKLVLETDAPDITPEPYRGRANEPAFLLETARRVALVKDVELATVAEVTTRNAAQLFSCRSHIIGDETQ